MITIPPIGSGEAQVMDSEPVAIDGTNVGTVTSASPLTLRLPVGEHNLAVGSYPTRIIDIDFAKTNNQMMSLTDTGGNPSESAASAASGANVVTNNIQGPRSFTGNTDSVQPFSVNQGGYIFTVPMMVLTISSYGLPTHRGTKSPYYSIPSVPIRAVKLSIFRQDNITWIFREQVPIQLIWLSRETARTYLFRFCQVVGR